MRHIKPGEYLGIKQIAARLGISRHQLMRLYRDYDFLMFKIPSFRLYPDTGNRIGGRTTWYTTEPLISQWQLMQIQKQKKLYREKLKYKHGRGGGNHPRKG